ncbi:RelA/SpoT family protein [Bacteroidota bacterium]
MKTKELTSFPEKFGPFCTDLANIVSKEVGLDADAVSAALLSDSWLQKRITREEVLQYSSAQVLLILEGLETISSVRAERSSHHSENFILLLLGLTKDIRVVLIRMAEVLSDLRKTDAIQKSQLRRLAGEAYYLYAPIAHRLGFYHIKTELEDRGMSLLFPSEYNLISGKLKETEKARNRYLQKFIAPVEASLRSQGFDFDIKGRSKTVHSIWKKMQKQQVGFEDVYDLLAIRVVLKKTQENEKSDCWKVYSLITDIYSPNPSRLRDWVSTPKPSGYEALHTTVEGGDGNWVEVQIRSARMDEKAERGEAAHWLYKEGKKMEESDQYLVQLRWKLENPELYLSEKERDKWINLNDPHIFIFTPQGDLKRLTNGSSVLDFAFQVHSDVGTHCTGAKVNGKSLPIKHILKNGDMVEIRTSKNQVPKQDWLKFVTSPRARQRIKKILRDEELKEAEAGKELLFRKLKNWKVPFTDASLDSVVKLLHFPTHMDLYQAIAVGKLDPLLVKEAILHPEGAGDKPEISVTPVHEYPTEQTSDDVIFLDKGLNNVNYTLASCCQPVFGDSVFGFITISRGISVHRTNCPNAGDLQRRYDYRVVRVKWRDAATSNAFQTTVKIQGIDQVGMLNTLSDIITNELKINIRSASIESDKGLFKGAIKVFVKDQKQVEKLTRRLAKINGVLKVTL